MKGSRHKDAYVRFTALVAAILRIVHRRDRARTQISSFLTCARKKFGRSYQRRGVPLERYNPGSSNAPNQSVLQSGMSFHDGFPWPESPLNIQGLSGGK